MRYVLIDGHNLAARCHYALPNLFRSDGTPTGVLHGFLRGVSYVRSLTRIGTSNTVICWDGGRAPGRLRLCPEYKQGRRLSEPKTDEERENTRAYKQQIIELQELLKLTGLRQICVKNVEADDLISIFSTMLSEVATVFIYSGDKDFHQMATDRIHIIDPKKGVLEKSSIEDAWGVKISEIVKHKCLTGDNSDNISGLPGVGPKRAIQIINGSISEKYKTLVAQNENLIERNRQLMELPKNWSETCYSFEQAKDALYQFGFKPQFKLTEFMDALRDWELNSTLEAINSWC